MWREIKRLINNYHSFVITTHANPDGDGLGAAAAMVELLLQMGKRVQFVCDSPISDKFRFLDFHSLFSTYNPLLPPEADMLIVLDTHRKERIGRLAQLSFKAICCIDHHEVTEPFTPYNAIDSKACSVGAMVYTLIKEFGHDLNFESATGIYCSIICDTGRFSYSSTNRKAHKIADECMKLGVDPDQMYGRLYQHVPLSQVRLFAQALQKMETYYDDRILIQELRQEDCHLDGINPEDLEHLDLDYIHEFNKWIKEVECFALLRELPDGLIRVSMRSKSNLDIGKILRKLGGGGHNKAAGATMKGPISDVKAKILNLLKGELSETAITS